MERVGPTARNGLDEWNEEKLVEAAGIEPFSPVNTNPMMAHDFGLYCVITFGLWRRFDSPGVPYSPLESSPVLEK